MIIKSKMCADKQENLSLNEQFLKEISHYKHIYIEVSGGYHSNHSVLQFHELGYKNVYEYEGGLKDWLKARLPVIRG